MTAQWDPKWTGPARQALLKNGYEPIPLNGNIPVLDAWQNLRPASEDIVSWETTLPRCQYRNPHHVTPAADDDVLDQEVADIFHEMVKELIPPIVRNYFATADSQSGPFSFAAIPLCKGFDRQMDC